MWIIIRTLKGKNCFLTGSRQWSKDRNEAERFDEFHYAVNCRDMEIDPSERRGVGVVFGQFPAYARAKSPPNRSNSRA